MSSMPNREEQICYLWDAVERTLPSGTQTKVYAIVNEVLEAMTDAALLEEYECADGVID